MTVPTAPPTTPTTVPADPYAVPATIDAAYLDQVLAALDQIEGDAARIIVKEGVLVPDAVDRLQAIYAHEELNEQLRAWGYILREELHELRQPPGNRISKVRRVIENTTSCVFVEVIQDFSAVAVNPPPSGVNYLGLEPVGDTLDPKNYNPTPWVISYSGVNPDESQPPSPCAPR